MIVIDFETNSHNTGDVIEVAILKVSKDENGKFTTKDIFHRYYNSKYPENPHALKIHKLSTSVLKEKREKANYPEFFTEDTAFEEFCSGASAIIAHNLPFELRHIDSRVSFSEHICTMKENKQIVKALNKNNQIKTPKLIECCHFYQIKFDPDKYHSAIYDVIKTLEVFNNMPVNKITIESILGEDEESSVEPKIG